MSPRLVVVHERFTEIGGSERVVEQVAGLSENARIFAPLVDRRAVPRGLIDTEFSNSNLQHLYRSPGRYAHLLPLLPVAMGNADMSDADVVVTSHHAFANWVKVRPEVPIISYTHTPARWMWDRAKRSGEWGGVVGGAALAAFASAARIGDRAAAQRVDELVANSWTVARRIRRWWGRESTVIHPPVNTEFFTTAPVQREDFLLVAGRLVPYKKAAVAVAAATRLGRRLVVAGAGRARPDLERIAGPTVEFLGPVSDGELRDLYRRCAGLLFPGEEDFGIVPVEAQACGAPVVAAKAGGALETVVDGVTGTHVEVARRDPVEAFCSAIRTFDPTLFDPAAIRSHAEQFSVDVFTTRFGSLLSRWVDGWPSSEMRPPGQDALEPLLTTHR